MRRFLWDGAENGGIDNLVTWKVVSRTKEEGGLGIGNLLQKKQAWLGKWIWRFPLEKGSLWVSIVTRKYRMQPNGWESNKASRGTQEFVP